jgi:predicted phosphoribosyltransferase
VKPLAGRTAVVVDGQVIFPWKVLAAAKAAEVLSATRVVIATPVATEVAAERIRARRYDFVCPSVLMDAEGHPSPFGDSAADTPERLKSIMIAHQAA